MARKTRDPDDPGAQSSTQPNCTANPENVNTLYREAIRYEGMLWSVIPLRPKGKKPLIMWEPYQKKRATWLQIQDWWEKWPDANVGVVTGAVSGIIVLDVDGPEGQESLKGKSLPPTVCAATGSGGVHYLYKHPGYEVRNFARKLPGLDLRADGGYVVAPPSIHPNGEKYEWIIPPDIEEPCPPPAWLMDLLEMKSSGDGSKVDPGKILAGVPEGIRDTELFKYAASLRARGIKKEEAVILVLQAARACNPPFPENEAMAKIESAWKYPEGVQPTEIKISACTDMGNGERFIRQHGDDVNYCMAWKKWFIWAGTHFEEDTTGQIYELAKSTAKNIPKETQGVEDEAQYKQLLKWAIQSQGRDKLRALVDLSATDPIVVARPEDFDKNPWLLNTMAGIINLRTGFLLPHDRQYLMTKIAPVAGKLNDKCPRWEQFLSEVFENNVELIKFVQRAVGYSLTGDISEQVLFVLFGAGSNGKSTFINTLAELFGPYHRQAASTAFLQSKRDTIGEELAPLVGARLVTVVEVDQGRRLAESLIKQATGGDSIRCRFLYSNSFEYRPQFKLWLAVNHKPKASGDDPAIWRRLRLVPFNARFSGDKQDKRLLEKLRAEMPGILAWAVQGCLKWQQEGLMAPKSVTEATTEWQQENDSIGQFLTECTLIRPYIKCRVRDLFSSYEKWSSELGEPSLSQRKFGQELRTRGFETTTSTGNQAYWQGIGLLEHQLDRGG